jgi:hypothetical protein
MYLPTKTKNTGSGTPTKKFKVFANLQTISISSTRSVSPVRVLGRSSAINYTRGARTFGGTMVFASIDKDAFMDVYDEALSESSLNSMHSFTPDQMPPFSIVITMSSEKGGTAYQIINGITLVNYGTTYSIDDIYTEQVYTYIATDITPLISTNTVYKNNNKTLQTSDFFKTIEDTLTQDFLDAALRTPNLSSIVYENLQKESDAFSQLNEPD